MKRAKLEKNKDEEQKPQELKEEDIQRSENETTKNVAVVRLPVLSTSSCRRIFSSREFWNKWRNRR